ncbi:hypothetical protein [Thiomicrorhabdus sp. 6S3-12]|nr:hypothetical protein [Thiomicrorhabdus sp. 6S3-12]
MPDMQSVGDALLITLALLGVSVLVVGLLMWWLYRVFRNKEER